MPVAPTPPTKPTPPVAPVLTPANSHTAADAPAAPATGTAPPAGKAGSGGLSDTAKKIEQLGQAFQGQTAKDKTKEQAAPSAPGKPSSIFAAPAAADTQTMPAGQTAVPPKPPLVNNKPPVSGYIVFIGIATVVAVIVVAIRLFTQKASRPQMPASPRTARPPQPEGREITVGPAAKPAKGKSNFEVRV